MLVWALRALGADPAFFVGGEVPGAGADGEAGQRRLGRGRVGRRRGRRERRQLPAAEPRDRGRHQRRDGPPLPLGLGRRAARGLRRVLGRQGVAVPADGAGRPAGELSLASTPRRPGPAELTLAVPGRHNLLNARAALAAVELAGLDVRGRGRGSRRLPRRAPAARAEGRARRRPRLRRLRPPPDRGARRPLGAARARARERLIAVFQPHLYSRTKAFGEEFGAALALADEVVGARRLPGPRAAGRRARGGQRPARRPRRRRSDGGRPAGLVRRPCDRAARQRSSPRLGPGRMLVTIGAGDVFTARRGAGRGDGAAS